jgi:lambda family phage portal protein
VSRRSAKQKAAPQAPLNVVNRYDAAGQGRRMRGWMPPSTGPNKAVEGLQTIRNRSRDASRNDWTGKSGTQHWTTNLIGTGIVPRLPKKLSKSKKEALSKLWDDWVKVCDADNVLNFYGLQTLFTKSWIMSGECFIRLRPRRSDSGLTVPLQVQLIEADFVPMLDADTWPGLPAGNRIRSGVELNRVGQRTAYWVYKEHPGDNKGRSVNPNDIIRVAKSQMLHVFEPERPGQLRGVPDFAPVLARLRNVADFDDAVLERQKIGNLFAGFVTKAIGQSFDDSVDPLTGKPIETDSSGAPIAGLEPGTMHELLPGEDVKFANPPEAGTTYADYMRSQNLGTAAGQGLPYELMSGDIKEVSDRTLRVVVNEFRRYAEQRQWQIVIPQACQPIREAWAEAAALAGQISLSDLEDAKAVEWSPQGWAYIHPVQDVQAKQTEVEAGFRSRSSVIAERGDDPEKVDEERAADEEREDELGLKPEPIMAPGQPGQPGEDSPDQPDEPPQPGQPPQSRAIDNLTLTVARLESFVHAKASEPRSEAQPIVINNHIPQTVVTNEVNPTPVTVENKVDVAPAAVSVTNEVSTPVVNVAAPNVMVTNEVQPAEVSVSLPDRQTTSLIERDREGNIINVTQTETTLQ